MPRRSLFVLHTLLFSLLAAPSLAQVVVDEDFAAYAPGTDASPAWQATGGFWYAADRMICSDTEAYDTGLLAAPFLDRAFELTMRFRVTSDYRGAGVLFNSLHRQSATFAHMIRLDDAQILYGYLDQGNFQGSGFVELPTSARDHAWHTVAVQVDPVAGTYAFSLDGEVLRENIPLRYRTGYAGLQNSGGAACFDDVTVRLDEEGVPASSIAWPASVAPDGRGGVWVGSAAGSVKRLSAKGEVATVLHKDIDRPFEAPIALAALPGGGVAVLDTTAHRLHRFDARGAWQSTTGFSRPAGLAALSDGRLAISDAGSVVLLAPDGTKTTLDSLDAERPTLLAAAGDRLVVLDEAAWRMQLLRERRGIWTLDIAIDAPSGGVQGLALTDRHLFAVNRNRILRYDLDGSLTATLDLEPFGDARPQRLAAESDRLLLPDLTDDRLLLADTALTSPALHHTFEDGSLVLTWNSTTASSGRIEVRTNDGFTLERAESQPGTAHRFDVEGLEHSTLYRIRYAPAFATLPAEAERPAEVVVMSPPPDGQVQYVEMKGVVLLFANVLDTTAATPGWPAMPPLPQAEIDRILAHVEDGRRFYWMNSGMRLHLDLEYVVVHEEVARDSLFGQEWYYPPRDSVAEQVLAKNGKAIDDYEALFYLAAVRDYDAATETWDLRGRGGAFTNGLGWNGRYGRSWWEVTRPDHRSGNNWLVVHEFHHQLDELFFLSGYPEYWFNHFAAHIGTAGDFGEHFDGNAHILKRWPEGRWFDLDHTRLRLAPDADGDGIPDNAPSVPMDERRLGTSASRTDTDGDGLTDKEEIMQANWITEGGGATYGAPAYFPDPTERDTDGDGLDDADDPAPTIPFVPIISHRDNGFALLGRTDDSRASYLLEGAWTPDSLYFRVNAPAGRRVRLLLDANADGWFQGRDNFLFLLETTDSLATTVEAFDAVIPNWPRMNASLLDQVGYTWRRLADGRYALALARSEDLGLRLHPSEVLGLDIGVSTTAPMGGRERDISLYEPNRFFDVTLQEK